jgi:restriction endonuclease PvuII
MRSSKEIVKDEGWGLPGEIDRSDDFGGPAGWCGVVDRRRRSEQRSYPTASNRPLWRGRIVGDSPFSIWRRLVRTRSTDSASSEPNTIERIANEDLARSRAEKHKRLIVHCVSFCRSTSACFITCANSSGWCCITASGDAFQGNGGKLLQSLLVVKLRRLQRRGGYAAVDNEGWEYELKTADIYLTKSFFTHHLNLGILKAHRTIEGWYLSIDGDLEVPEIYKMTQAHEPEVASACCQSSVSRNARSSSSQVVATRLGSEKIRQKKKDGP